MNTNYIFLIVLLLAFVSSQGLLKSSTDYTDQNSPKKLAPGQAIPREGCSVSNKPLKCEEAGIRIKAKKIFEKMYPDQQMDPIDSANSSEKACAVKYMFRPTPTSKDKRRGESQKIFGYKFESKHCDWVVNSISDETKRAFT